MPRKLRTAKGRRYTQQDVSECLWQLLVYDDFRGAIEAAERNGTNVWEAFGYIADHRATWQLIEAEALVEWTEKYPGTRPHAWWELSACELRQVHGRFTPSRGRWRCHDTGIPYGRPDDLEDLPMVECEPGYLDRCNLWLPGERSRVPAAAFEPQPFAWSLTQSSHGREDEELDEQD